MIKIIPAINVQSFEEFKQRIISLIDLTNYFHFDIAKESFCGYNSYDDVFDIERIGKDVKLDLHLMDYVLPLSLFNFNKSYIKRLIFHLKVSNPEGLIKVGRKIKKEIFFAIEPQEDPQILRNYANWIDGLLIMGVSPGRSGQKLDERSLDNLRKVKKDFKNLKIGFDGGVKKENFQEILKYKPDFIVIGSAIYSSQDPKSEYLYFKKISSMV